MDKAQNKIVREIISDSAAALALVEIAIGAFVHGFKIPLGGHLLSLNQGAFLTRATKALRKAPGTFRFPIYVSSIASILKSLSPAGNKLGPMVSISMQGVLFALPVAILGPNLFGVILGMVLLSFWSFLQPFALLYLFYGNDLAHAIEFYLAKVDEGLPWLPFTIVQALIFIASVKAVLAILTGFLAFKVSDEAFAKYRAFWRPQKTAAGFKWPEQNQNAPLGQRLRFVLRDLTRPFFLFSIVLMAVFFFFMENSWSRMIWLLLRPLAIAFIFFYLARSPIISRLAGWMRSKKLFAPFMEVFDRTVEKISL